MLNFYKPNLEDLWFRQELLSNSATMSYNNAWGGTIDFSKENWDEWYKRWVLADKYDKYYRYLRLEETGKFVGEAAYYRDIDRCIYLASIIVSARFRGNGYGTQGLKLLCSAAKENGISILYDDITMDNPAVRLFLKNGFCIDRQADNIITLKKILI